MGYNDGSENSDYCLKSDQENFGAATIHKTDYVDGDLLYFRILNTGYGDVTPWVQSNGSGTTNLYYYSRQSYAQWQSYILEAIATSGIYLLAVYGNHNLKIKRQGISLSL